MAQRRPATEQTRSDIGEIRRLVDGLRPPALDQFGLVSALRQRAEEHNLAARAADDTMLWTIRGSDDVEPLPAAVEVAAYRIVIEAVNNALQHSKAPTCEVEPGRIRTHSPSRCATRAPAYPPQTVWVSASAPCGNAQRNSAAPSS